MRNEVKQGHAGNNGATITSTQEMTEIASLEMSILGHMLMMVHIHHHIKGQNKNTHTLALTGSKKA